MGNGNSGGGHEWTDEERDMVKTMWLAGDSAGIIAQAIGQGLSRNSIIGIIKRMEIKRDVGVGPKRRKTGHSGFRAGNQLARKLVPRQTVLPPSGHPWRGGPTIRERETVASPEVREALHLENFVRPRLMGLSGDRLEVGLRECYEGSLHVSILALRPRTCRWPDANTHGASMTYCGRRTAGDGCAYCEDHARDSTGVPRLDPLR